jgi:hypothetical protein
MRETSTPRPVNALRALSLILALLALSGWGATERNGLRQPTGSRR